MSNKTDKKIIAVSINWLVNPAFMDHFKLLDSSQEATFSSDIDAYWAINFANERDVQGCLYCVREYENYQSLEELAQEKAAQDLENKADQEQFEAENYHGEMEDEGHY